MTTDKFQNAKTIAFVHYKGGTGKTTSCLNIAGWLMKMNQKVLVVDLDPQGSATAGLGVDRSVLEGSMYSVFLGRMGVEEVILETNPGVYLAPSSIELLGMERRIGSHVNNTGILAENLEAVRRHFDYILIDVPPGSSLLTINGIVAAEGIIIPLDPGVFAYEAMETLKTVVMHLNEDLGIETNVMMILLRKYGTGILNDGQTREVQKMLKEFLETNLIADVKIFTIPYSRKVHKSQMKGMPISHYAPLSNVGRRYKMIAKEIVESRE